MFRNFEFCITDILSELKRWTYVFFDNTNNGTSSSEWNMIFYSWKRNWIKTFQLLIMLPIFDFRISKFFCPIIHNSIFHFRNFVLFSTVIIIIIILFLFFPTTVVSFENFFSFMDCFNSQNSMQFNNFQFNVSVIRYLCSDFWFSNSCFTVINSSIFFV